MKMKYQNAKVSDMKRANYRHFLNNLLIKDKATEEEIKTLVDDMIKNALKYLPAA